jgi:hypothetical protein
MPEQKSQRLNLRISVEDEKRLDDLVKLSAAPSITEVIRRSLAVYEHLLKSNRAGKQIVVRDKDGTERNLLLL